MRGGKDADRVRSYGHLFGGALPWTDAGAASRGGLVPYREREFAEGFVPGRGGGGGVPPGRGAGDVGGGWEGGVGGHDLLFDFASGGCGAAVDECADPQDRRSDGGRGGAAGEQDRPDLLQ